MSLVLNEPVASARRKVELVDAVRVALGKCEMPRAWVEALAGSRAERSLWLTDERLRFPEPGD